MLQKIKQAQRSSEESEAAAFEQFGGPTFFNECSPVNLQHPPTTGTNATSTPVNAEALYFSP
jgi:hypothetical protein